MRMRKVHLWDGRVILSNRPIAPRTSVAHRCVLQCTDSSSYTDGLKEKVAGVHYTSTAFSFSLQKI